MIRIFHLDDQQLFQVAMKTCVQKYIQEVDIQVAIENESALIYLSGCLDRNQHPDLIITDFNHPKGSGLDFIRDYRKIEAPFGIHIPILMYTMMNCTDIFHEALTEGSLDAYLSKSSNEHRILCSIHNLLAKSLEKKL